LTPTTAEAVAHAEAIENTLGNAGIALEQVHHGAQFHHQTKVITVDEQRRAVDAVIAFVGERVEPPLSGTW
jgi:hypothetical protein